MRGPRSRQRGLCERCSTAARSAASPPCPLARRCRPPRGPRLAYGTLRHWGRWTRSCSGSSTGRDPLLPCLIGVALYQIGHTRAAVRCRRPPLKRPRRWRPRRRSSMRFSAAICASVTRSTPPPIPSRSGRIPAGGSGASSADGPTTGRRCSRPGTSGRPGRAGERAVIARDALAALAKRIPQRRRGRRPHRFAAASGDRLARLAGAFSDGTWARLARRSASRRGNARAHACAAPGGKTTPRGTADVEIVALDADGAGSYARILHGFRMGARAWRDRG